MRPTQKSAPAETGIESLLAGLRRNERINELEEFAALQTKAAHLLEADKLAKRHALPTRNSCLLCGYGSTTSKRALQEKEQAKLAESDETARNAAKALNQAKENAVKRQEAIDRFYERERARLVPHI